MGITKTQIEQFLTVLLKNQLSSVMMITSNKMYPIV